MNDNDRRSRTFFTSRFEVSPTQYIAWGALIILVTILLCVGGIWLLGLRTPSAAVVPVSRAKVELATPLQPGQPMTIQGTGFQASERVEIFTAMAPNAPFSQLSKLGDAVADGNGNFVLANVPVPANAGSLFLVGRGSGSGFTSFSSVSGAPAGGTAVVPPPVTPGPTPTWTAVPAQGASNLPDLAIGSLSIDTQSPYVCSVNTAPLLGVKVDIRNTTPYPSGPFIVVVNNAQYTVNTGLEGGKSIVLWFPGYQTGTNRVVIDSGNTVNELSEQNNTLELPLAVPTPPPACTVAPNVSTPVPPQPPGPTGTPDPNAVNVWYAQYYSNQDLFEPAVIRRYEPGNPFLNLDWRGGSPGAGLPNDGFSGVMTRVQEFPSTDNYVFDFTVDDGGRLFIDGALVIDEWRNGPARTVQASRSLSKGPHTIRIEFYEATAAARVALSWKSSYTGWRGRYYNNTDRTGQPVIIRDDKDPGGGPGLDFDWGFGSPAAEIGFDGFSVDWQRSLNFQAGTYIFTIDVDDGVRFFVDGAPLIDNYATTGSRVVTVTRVLNAGAHSLQVQYVEYSGQSKFKLTWEKVVPPPTNTPLPPPTAPPSSTPPPTVLPPTAPPSPTSAPPTDTPVVIPTNTLPPPPPPPPTDTPVPLVVVTSAP